MRNIRLRVVVANIMCNPRMPQGWVEDDMEAIYQHHPDVVMWSEVEIWRYQNALSEVFMPHLWNNQFNFGIESPISLRISKFPGYQRFTHNWIKAHSGRPLTTPRRVIAFTLDHDLKILFLTGHDVSGAWNRKKKLFKKWRQRMWTRHWNKAKHLIDDYTERGYAVIYGTDFNRLNVPAFSDYQHTAVEHGIDKLFVISGPETKIKVLKHGKVEGLHTDHPAIWADLEIIVP